MKDKQNFGAVVEALRAGLNAKREKWKNSHIKLHDLNGDITQPHIVLCYEGRRAVMPIFDQDIFAEDWIIFE
jgi:hypothetical protein